MYVQVEELQMVVEADYDIGITIRVRSMHNERIVNLIRWCNIQRNKDIAVVRRNDQGGVGVTAGQDHPEGSRLVPRSGRR